MCDIKIFVLKTPKAKITFTRTNLKTKQDLALNNNFSETIFTLEAISSHACLQLMRKQCQNVILSYQILNKTALMKHSTYFQSVPLHAWNGIITEHQPSKYQVRYVGKSRQNILLAPKIANFVKQFSKLSSENYPSSATPKKLITKIKNISQFFNSTFHLS